MVDAALPKSDRVDLDDDLADVEQAVARLAKSERDAAAVEPPPRKDVGGALVTLDADDWRRLANSTLAAPPLVDRVLKAIRRHTGDHRGKVTIAGSLGGWSALLSYQLERGICCDLGAKITAQVARGNA